MFDLLLVVLSSCASFIASGEDNADGMGVFGVDEEGGGRSWGIFIYRSSILCRIYCRYIS